MRKALWIGLAAAMLLPTVLQAQTRKKPRQNTPVIHVKRESRRDCCWGNRWLLEPYVGAFNDAYDISPDGDETSLLLGGRVGYMLSRRTRLLGNVGYTRSDDVADPLGNTNYFVYDNTWVFTTAGFEFDVIPGGTSASLGVQAGAAWRRVDEDGRIGSPIGQPISDPGFSSHEVVVPSFVVRHQFLGRATLTAGLHDYITDVFEGPAQHSVAFTAGLAFR